MTASQSPISIPSKADPHLVHGVWDAQSKFLGPNLATHTNITEIDMGLDLLWRAGVEPGKVVLGLGWVSLYLNRDFEYHD